MNKKQSKPSKANREAVRKIDWANERLPLARWLYEREHWETYSRWKSLSNSEQESYCYLADEVIKLGYRRNYSPKPSTANNDHNRLTWKERHPDNYEVKKVFIKDCLKKPSKANKEVNKMADKKVDCSYVNGHQPDCIDADTEACKTCCNDNAIKREISYYRKIETE